MSMAFHPHGTCFLWMREMIAWHVISDALIAMAYVVISFALIIFRSHISLSQALPRWAFASFGTFIFACGMTHVMDIVVVWFPIYVAQGTIKTICALASISTAAILVGVLRNFLKKPIYAPDKFY